MKEWTHDQFKATDFYRKNEIICSQPRGLGYWIWKPYIILDLMNTLPDGEIALYLDAGVETINNLNYIVDRMDQDIFLFGNEWEHYQWCKADIIHEIWPSGLRDRNNPGWLCFGKQAQASAIFFRVNDRTRAFVKEWLDWCLFEGGRLVDDSPSRAPNHSDFRENRHDQAILTTLAYREGIKLHGWFVRYPAFEPARVGYESDNYPTLFLHHRYRNHEWPQEAGS